MTFLICNRFANTITNQNQPGRGIDAMSYLSETGKEIYKALEKHCRGVLKTKEVDSFELEMLANSFDLYAINAEYCRDHGTTQSPVKGGWDQIRPEYTVMKNEYQNILKHGAKFGLNPGDREKIFSNLDKGKKKGFDLGNDKMKVA